MRKAPLINILFGGLNILEAAQKSLSGDLEAAIHSLYATGYNFTSAGISYAPGLKSKENLDRNYVNGVNASANFIGYFIDWFHKHTFVSRVDTQDSYQARLFSRSISYSLLPLQQMIAVTGDCFELWEKAKNDK